MFDPDRRPPEDYEPGEHHVAVRYTSRDDGIHLDCSCGFDQPADFWPTPQLLLDMEQAHLRDVGYTRP